MSTHTTPAAKDSPIKAEDNTAHLEDIAEFRAPLTIAEEEKDKSNDGAEKLLIPEQMSESSGEKPVEACQDLKKEGGTIPAKDSSNKESPATQLLNGALGEIQRKRKVRSDDDPIDTQSTKKKQSGNDKGLFFFPSNTVAFKPRKKWQVLLTAGQGPAHEDFVMEELRKPGGILKQYACALNDARPELRERYRKKLDEKDKKMFDEHFWNMYQCPDRYDPSRSFPRILTPRILDDMIAERGLKDKLCCICVKPFEDWDRYVKKECGRHIMHYKCPEEKEEKKLGILEEGKCGCQEQRLGTPKG
ncbi:hypothetical protein FBULB1_1436 [Fusarium bulbicola]|nr:hypothetical protein FBULB1_1436 [Fusarium bulbicola]